MKNCEFTSYGRKFQTNKKFLEIYVETCPPTKSTLIKIKTINVQFDPSGNDIEYWAQINIVIYKRILPNKVIAKKYKAN